MKFLLSILLILSGLAQAENKHELGIVKDPDGFTNVRSQPDLKSDILGTVPSNRMLSFQRFDESWVIINRYAWDGYRDGFIHSSRVFPIMELGIQDIEPAYGQAWRTEKKLIMLGDIEITMFDANRILREEYDFPMFHSSYLEIKVPNQKPIRKYYPSMEPLGGRAGLGYVPVLSEPDFRFFVKEGDYDSRTIIVTKDGRVVDLEGGAFWIYKNLLISEIGDVVYEGTIVWDMKQEKLLYRPEDNPDIYAENGIDEFETTYYIASGELYLKIEALFNEDLPLSFYRLDKNGRFVSESNPPTIEEELEMYYWKDD